jgi:hypothetical protein
VPTSSANQISFEIPRLSLIPVLSALDIVPHLQSLALAWPDPLQFASSELSHLVDADIYKKFVSRMRPLVYAAGNTTLTPALCFVFVDLCVCLWILSLSQMRVMAPLRQRKCHEVASSRLVPHAAILMPPHQPRDFYRVPPTLHRVLPTCTPIPTMMTMCPCASRIQQRRDQHTEQRNPICIRKVKVTLSVSNCGHLRFSLVFVFFQ